MQEPPTPPEPEPPPEVGGNWFILFGAVPAALVLGVAAWLALSRPLPPPVPAPPPPPAPPGATTRR